MSTDWEYPRFKEGKPTKYGWTIYHKDGFVLGKYTDIGAGTHIFCQYGVKIEDYVQIGGGCYIYSESTINNKRAHIILKENCKIGALTVIMPGVIIGKNTIVGAHSFVTKSIPDNCIAYGVPATVKGRLPP